MGKSLAYLDLPSCFCFTLSSSSSFYKYIFLIFSSLIRCLHSCNVSALLFGIFASLHVGRFLWIALSANCNVIVFYFQMQCWMSLPQKSMTLLNQPCHYPNRYVTTESISLLKQQCHYWNKYITTESIMSFLKHHRQYWNKHVPTNTRMPPLEQACDYWNKHVTTETGLWLLKHACDYQNKHTTTETSIWLLK